MLGVYDTRAAHYGALGCGHELPALQAAAVSPRRLVALQAHGQQDLTQMECQMLAKWKTTAHNLRCHSVQWMHPIPAKST